MKYEVRTNKVENGSNNVVGLASVIIDDKFVVNNIRLIHKPDEDKYSVIYPARKTTKTDSGYTNICHPYTSELAQQLKEAILTAYNTGENQIVENGTEFELSVNVTPYEKESLVGLCNVRFSKHNEFAINDITIRQGPEEKFVSMPSYKKNDGEYADICHPITKEFREELIETIMSAYQESLEKSKEKTEEKSKDGTFEHKKNNNKSR